MPPFFPHHLASDIVYDPITTNATDILEHDPDLEDDIEQRGVKRQRIESIAAQYLRGTTPYIFSAVLRGPLGGGWSPPWTQERKSGQARSISRVEELKDEILRRRVVEKAEKKGRRPLQQTERDFGVGKLHKDGLRSTIAHTAELMQEHDKDLSRRGRVHLEKRHADGFYRPTSALKGGLEEGSSQESGLGKASDRNSFARSKKVQSMTRQWLGRDDGTPSPKSPNQETSANLTTRITPSKSPRARRNSLNTKDKLLLRESLEPNLKPCCPSLPSVGNTLTLELPSTAMAKERTTKTYAVDSFNDLRDSQRDESSTRPCAFIDDFSNVIASRPTSNRHSDQEAYLGDTDCVQTSSTTTNSKWDFTDNRIETTNDLENRVLPKKNSGFPNPITFNKVSHTLIESTGFTSINQRIPVHSLVASTIQPDPTAQANQTSTVSSNNQYSLPSPVHLELPSLNGMARTYDSSDENWLGLQEAKRLSQRALEDALESSSEGDVGDQRDWEGYHSAKGLALQAAERTHRAVGHIERSPLKLEVQLTAERCAKASSGSKKDGASGYLSKTKTAGKLTRVNVQKARKDRLQDLRHPYPASPIPTSSSGYIHRKAGAKDVDSITQKGWDVIKAKYGANVPQRRKPRPVTFESSPAAPANRESGTKQCEKSDERKSALVNVPSVFISDGAHQNKSIGPETLSNPRTHKPGESIGSNIPVDQEANVQTPPSGDLSAQAAMLQAQRDFQGELGSYTPDVVPVSGGYQTNMLIEEGQGGITNAITPFHAFNVGPGDSESPTHVEGILPISTQELFNAASTFAFSATKKNKNAHRASFAAIAVQKTEDYPTYNHHDGKDGAVDRLQTHHATAVRDLSGGMQDMVLNSGLTQDCSPADYHASVQGIPNSNRRPLEERNSRSSFHNSSSSQPKSSRPRGITFAIAPSGSLKEVPDQDGQRFLDDVDINAELDFAGSFLDSWDLDLGLTVRK
ncbi:hypothetical protein K432DRAFT_421018 [Lepidopterella palustris CBS 459.81]|uniref:Uncharacterized protein n=1 Tax=Lepidopterella palustris CBS 459.81 TaxID=1314670 RepID=A0A8E2EME4_9PEZI|nr:hypothetical protein K432DRAFT_421018 [Lepidopterella palustris CBS 459.81]